MRNFFVNVQKKQRLLVPVLVVIATALALMALTFRTLPQAPAAVGGRGGGSLGGNSGENIAASQEKSSAGSGPQSAEVRDLLQERMAKWKKETKLFEMKTNIIGSETSKQEREFQRLQARNKILKNQKKLLENAKPNEFQVHPTTMEPLKMECDAFNVPTQRISRVIYTIWKNEKLIKEAARVDQQWKIKEPCFTRRTVTDAECDTLAERFPGLKPLYYALPMNVMRADICRVLVVYYYGGIYMDLDVAWVKPLKHWFNVSADMVLGKEYDDGRFFCNWFFAAEKKHPCLKSVLELIMERIDRKFDKSEFGSNPWLVHETTGPKTFADALKKCGAVAQLNSVQVNNEYIKHLYGSQRWRNEEGYSSWNKERQAMGGWKSMLGHGMLPKDQQEYLKLPNALLVFNNITEATKKADGKKLGPLKIKSVSQSTTPYEALGVYGTADLAIDNYMESFSKTNSLPAEAPHWEIVFEEAIKLAPFAYDANNPASIPKVGHELSCIRILNRRDGDFVLNDLVVEFFGVDETGAENHLLYTVANPLRSGGGMVMIRPWQMFKEHERASQQGVKRIKITRGGEVSIAEFQIFTDGGQCNVYRELQLKKPELVGGGSSEADLALKNTFTAYVKDMYHLLGHRTWRCPDVKLVGEKGDDDGQWAVCGLETPLPGQVPHNGATAILVQKTTEAVMEQDLLEYGYKVHTLDHRFENNKRVHPVDTANTKAFYEYNKMLQVDGKDDDDKHVSIKTFLAKLAVDTPNRDKTKISILKLNQESAEWDMVMTLVLLAAKKQVDQLLIEFHPCGKRLWSPENVVKYIRLLKALHAKYYLFSSRTNERGHHERNPVASPCCVKLSFIRKSLVDGHLASDLPSTSSSSSSSAGPQSSDQTELDGIEPPNSAVDESRKGDVF